MAILLRGLEKEPKLNGREVKLALGLKMLMNASSGLLSCSFFIRIALKVRKSPPPMFGECERSTRDLNSGHLWIFAGFSTVTSPICQFTTFSISSSTCKLVRFKSSFIINQLWG